MFDVATAEALWVGLKEVSSIDMGECSLFQPWGVA